MAKKCVIGVFFCFSYNVAFSFAFMITEKLFLLHRLLFIPYFNNPQGGGEGRGGKVGTPNDGLYGLYYPKRGVMKR